MPSYKVKLEICGASYTISTSDPIEYVQTLADRLNEDMQQIMQSSSNPSVVSSAIVTALGYLDDEAKTRQSADNMRVQIQDYLEDASKARLAAEEARREVERLRNELRYYEKLTKESAPKQPEPEPAAEESPLLSVPSEDEEPQKSGDAESPGEIEGQMGLDDFSAQ